MQSLSAQPSEREQDVAISTSEIRVSCVIGAKYGELAVRALHTEFGLDSPAV